MSAPEDVAAARTRVYELTRTGHSAREIAAQLGITTRTVIRHRRATGCAEPVPVPLTPRQEADARRLLDDGASLTEAARTVGCSQRALYRRWPDAAWSGDQVQEFARFMAQKSRQGILT